MCKLCGKGFAQRTPLKTHERTHNVDRPGSACTLCGLVFRSKIELESHMKVCFATQLPFAAAYGMNPMNSVTYKVEPQT